MLPNLFNVSFVGGLSIASYFNSLYESFNPLTTVNKQHFIEWFSGKGLRSIWTQENIVGTGTFIMVDTIDEGFSITSGASVNNRSAIDFNNIRHYSNTGSVVLSISKRSSGSLLFTGFNGQTEIINGTQCSNAIDRSDVSFKRLQTGDASASTNTDSDLGVDTSWHLYKIVVGSSNSVMTIDGAHTTTSSTHLPTVKLQPEISSFNLGTTTEIRTKYLECYNT